MMCARARVAAALLCCAVAFPDVEAAGATAAHRGGRGAKAAIQRVLDARARAWLRRDEDAFLATVSRDLPSFRRSQRNSFRWAAALPFASYTLEARWDRYGSQSTPAVAKRYPRAAAVVVAVVQERYRLDGFDDRDDTEDMFLTFVREGGRWLVASDDDLRALGLQSARHLWDFGPLQQQRSKHFLVLTHPCGAPPGCPPLPPDFGALAEQALGRVRRVWRAPWNDHVVILVPSSTAELARMIQATFGLQDFVAFAVSSVDVERGLRYGGNRVVVKASAVAGRASGAVVTILAHELLHVATRSVSGPFVPAFVDEGIAEYVGHYADPNALAFLRSEIVSGAFDGRLPADYQFVTGRAGDIYTSYQKAQSAIRFFVSRWGWAKLTSFYRRLGRPAIAPGTSRYHLDRALRATIGMGLASFQRTWADSIGQP